MENFSDFKDSYSILKEVKQLVNNLKPPTIDEADWEKADRDIKNLTIEVVDLKLCLEDGYRKAVREKNWLRALIFLQCCVMAPFFPPLRYLDQPEITEIQKKYASLATDWLTEVKTGIETE